MTEIIDGNAVAQSIRDDLVASIDHLADAGERPSLATVLMSEDPASETYVSMKQNDCEEVGIEQSTSTSTPTRTLPNCTTLSRTSTPTTTSTASWSRCRSPTTSRTGRSCEPSTR